MISLALFGDLHGNLTATEAAYADLQRRRPSTPVWVLGDMVGKGPRPREVLDWTVNHAQKVIAGNWDARIAAGSPRPQDQWPREKLTTSQLKYLTNLPYGIEEKLGGQWWRFVHTGSAGLFERLYPQAPNAEKERHYQPFAEHGLYKRAYGLVYADLHEAFVTSVETRTGTRPLLNCGSVGNPLDSTLGSYLLLDFEGRHTDGWAATVVRFVYDREHEIEIAQHSDMPFLAEYIHELRTGEYRKRRA